MASLYEITGEYAALLGALEAAETDEEAEAIYLSIEAVDADLGAKADAYARIMRNYQSDAEALKAEIDRLAAKKKRAEAAVERMKAAMLENMQKLGLKDIQTSIGKWRVQQNPWSCSVQDPDEVPAEYHIPQPDKIDARGILDNFKATGEILPGVEITRREGVRFR